MKRITHFIILAAFLISTGGRAQACSIVLSTYCRPDYMDLNYRPDPNKEYDALYTRKTPYLRLLSQYLPEEQLKEPDLYAPIEKKSDPVKKGESADSQTKAYAEASSYFYKHDYEKALSGFEHLINTPDALIKEKALYMVGRIPLIMAQKKWDGDSLPSSATIDYASLAQSQKAFDHYIDIYPQGHYTRSAQSLRRRIAYLRGDQERLNTLLFEMLNELFRHTQAHQFTDKVYDRVIEFSRFAKPMTPHLATDHPLTIAAAFMFCPTCIPNDAIDNLTQRENDFSPYKGLQRFLRAFVYTKKEDYEGLLRAIPQEIQLMDEPAAIATEALRAHAFSHLNKSIEALACWERINSVHKNDDVAQLNLAQMYIKTHDYERLLSQDAPITNPRILRDFIQYALTTDNLLTLYTAVQKTPEKFKNEARTDIEHELFRRYVLTAQFKEMAALYTQAQAPNLYGKIRRDIEFLAKNPTHTPSLGRVGLFLYRSFIAPQSPALGFKHSPPFSYSEDSFSEIRPYCVPCADYEKQPWAQPTHWSAYKYLLKAENLYSNERKQDAIEPEVLHTLVGCFRSSNYKEQCGVPSEARNQGQTWWQKLHSTYRTSQWARKTPYWFESHSNER